MKQSTIELYGNPVCRIGAAVSFATSFTRSHRKHPVSHFRLSLLCVTAVLFLSQRALSTQIQNEHWISLSTDTPPGLGTLQDPYDGSTQAKFDAVMQNLTTA